MQENFWKKINRKYDELHLQDTEIRTSGESVFINPTVKLVVAWGLFLLVFILFLIIGKPFAKADKPAVGMDGTIISNEEYIPFERNEYPEVNSFVENYLNAITTADINVLSTMVVDPAQFDVAILERKKQMVLNYSNVDCYTKPGLTEGSYVVYAVVNTQIAGVEIQPLSLHQFYLMPNEFGGFVQNNTASTNPEIDAYMNQIDRDPDVVDLYKRVNDNNTESAKNDEALRAFYESINVQLDYD